MTVLGKRGYGKTTFANAIIEQVKGKKPIIIFDVLGEYEGDYIFTNHDDFVNFGIDNGIKNKIYVTRFDSDDDNIDLFNTLANLNGLYIVIEESDMFCKPSFIEPDFASIIKYGRHNNLNYLAISRRAAEIHKHVIAQSHYAVSFRQSLPLDVDTLVKFGFSEEIKTLQVFEYEMIEI